MNFFDFFSHFEVLDDLQVHVYWFDSIQSILQIGKFTLSYALCRSLLHHLVRCKLS